MHGALVLTFGFEPPERHCLTSPSSHIMGAVENRRSTKIQYTEACSISPELHYKRADLKSVGHMTCEAKKITSYFLALAPNIVRNKRTRKARSTTLYTCKPLAKVGASDLSLTAVTPIS